MLIAERVSKRTRQQDKMTYKDYIIIGFAQANLLIKI